MSDEYFTVAQTAERLGTTIPRLRRLLARPEMADSCQVVPVSTLRGTRISTVIAVSELPKLAQALEQGANNTNPKNQEQKRGVMFSDMEFSALQTTLRRTEELLVSKNKELAAQEEVIRLLREKILVLEQAQEHRLTSQEHGQKTHVPVPQISSQIMKDIEGSAIFQELDGRPDPLERSFGPGLDSRKNTQNRNEPPASVWARFYRWFREA